jgi:D-alanyl-D-alanine carboxypeptidase
MFALLTGVILAGCTKVPAPSASRAAPAPSVSPAPSPAPGSPSPGSPSPSPFGADVGALPADVATEMTGVSWRPECPVPLSALRLVHVPYWGFDGAPHRGELVVNASIANPTTQVFTRLYEARFPIRKMQRVEAYRGSDTASMADDNTSGFNCRRLYGSTTWSLHAYGLAIDVNTVENPYLHDGLIEPPAGAGYLDRHQVRPGMIVSGDVVTREFKAAGFTWGGDFTSIKDYQHFQRG